MSDFNQYLVCRQIEYSDNLYTKKLEWWFADLEIYNTPEAAYAAAKRMATQWDDPAFILKLVGTVGVARIFNVQKEKEAKSGD